MAVKKKGRPQSRVMLEADIEEAMALQGVTGVTARSLALYIQAVLQGGFVLAKAIGGADIARESVAHLKRYFEMLFNHPKKQAK